MTNLRGTFHYRRLTVERFAVKRFNGLLDGSSTKNPNHEQP
jgi:hypothetical protein